MDSYAYNGHIWTSSPTVDDKNSFFHAAFGVRNHKNEPYFDKHAKFRRMGWSTFLTYFENETMPSCLTEMLKKCLNAIEKYKEIAIEDQKQFSRYIYDIIFEDRGVRVEELPIIATLENIKIVIFLDDASQPIIVKPNTEILGSFSNVSGASKEVVLCLKEGIFRKLNPVIQKLGVKPKKNDTIVENESLDKDLRQSGQVSFKYIKTGTAGCKGVEFQVGLLTVFLLNAFRRRLDNWRLSTENKRGGKFDDVILECSKGDVLLQAKFKENKTKTDITLYDLMPVSSKNVDYSLPKYFLSYQEIKSKFNIKNVVVCTNASFHKSVLPYLTQHKVQSQSMLHWDRSDGSFYTFNDNILPPLKENTKSYLRKINVKCLDETVVTDENLRDFLGHVQFYTDFPAGDDLDEIAKQILSQINLEQQTSRADVHTKVMNWYKQKKGVCLTESHTKGIFLEIWRDKYWQKLEQYKVYFRCNDFIFNETGRVVHITTDGGYFLQELKLYRAFDDQSKILYLKYDDGICFQRQVIESFWLPRYTFLIVVWNSLSQELPKEMCDELKNILHKYEYKKIVVVATCGCKTISQIYDEYSVVEGSVVFGDFSKDTQGTLLKREIVIFQGNTVSIEELFTNQTTQDYDKILNSELLEKIINNDKIRVGSPLVGLNEDTAHFYIARQLKKKVKENDRLKNIKEIIPEEKIFEANERLILISDVAGMGKSTTITNLATTIKLNNPHLWVIRIELNDYTEILKTLLESNATTVNVTELLNAKRATQFENQLERHVFDLKRKVVFMMDGIDEISPDYTDLILNMLIKCPKVTNFAKIFATTRPHMTKELQRNLHVEPYVLQPLSEENQIEFLTGYWTYHLGLEYRNKARCKKYAQALITKMNTWTKDYQAENNFPGVPLQARMLADIFQGGCKAYLMTDEDEPTLPVEMDMVKMYEMFIENKRKVFMDKSNQAGNTIVKQILRDKFNELLLDHRNLALEIILGEIKCGLFSGYRKSEDDPKKNLVKIGIVQKINSDSHFIHRTFAEYFVGESMLNAVLQSKNVEFQRFFIDEVLLNNEYAMICAFLDGFLHRHVANLSSNIFERYRSLKNTITLPESYKKANLIFWLAKQGFVRILQLVFKCIDFKIIRNEQFSIMQLYETDFDEGGNSIKEHIFGNTLNLLQHLMSLGGVNITNAQDKTPLHLASEQGHLEMVKFLVSQGANIESTDSSWRTPLHVAVYYNHFDVARFLVEQGANIKSRDKNGHTIPYESITGCDENIVSFLFERILEKDGLDVLDSMIPYMAAYLGRLDIIQPLLKKGLNINELFEGDQTLICFAAMGGQLNTVEYLVRHGADINIKDSDGNTVLHVAVLEGQFDIVRFLVVKCDINVNTKSYFAGTALNLAVLSGHLDIVKFLIAHGGNVHVRDEYDNTALQMAVSMGRWDILKFLVIEGGLDINVTDNNGCTPLHLAISKNQFDIVRFFIDRGANINERDNHGRTALHSSVKAGRLNTATTLITEYKVDIHVRDKNGRTALHLAAKDGDAHICDFLVRSGADVNFMDSKGLTAMHLAASWGKLDVVKLFVNLGVDIYFKDGSDCTALHRAASWNRLETVKFFINDCGMNINARDRYNKTALHLSAEMNNLETVQFLVENNADINVKSNGGCSALHLSALRGHLEVVEFLARHGADIHAVESFGRTALHLAAVGNQVNVVEFLVKQGVEINARDDKGSTALNIADSRACFGIATFLLKSGAHFGVAPVT